MGKRLTVLTLCLLLAAVPALGERGIDRQEGQDYFPSEENWTYSYHYSVPFLAGEDDAAVLVNDTLAAVLEESRKLTLPMLAQADAMVAEGRHVIDQTGEAVCNDGVLYAILTVRKEQVEGQTPFYALEADTFDVSGEYLGETLTLRGILTAYPMDGDTEAALLSSDEMGELLLPVLYERFRTLQAEGVCRAEVTEADFYRVCTPTVDYYPDGQGGAVFFLQPSLMTAPGPDVPTAVFSAEELAALCRAAGNAAGK